ncbi:MAG: c-type cytochrome, partial [Burkholderiaceae bacterium]
MSRPVELALALLLAVAGPVAAQAVAYTGIGRVATPAEVAAWDIDVRPDFKGLPPGSGSVASGMAVWESKCASCHGVFGESNQFFSPLVGGTSASDIARGRAARLDDPAYPARTTLMKLASLSTLWDYIRRAMPWNNPKSLSNDEVYAVTAYVLNLGDIVPASFVLSDRNMAEVQQRLPNRDGMTTAHALWPGRPGPADVASPARACMQACATEVAITSSMPDAARGAHGNLAAQAVAYTGIGRVATPAE